MLPSRLCHVCAQVRHGGAQGSASSHGEARQIALKSAKCQSPARCPSSRQAKIKQTGRERSWVGLFKNVNFKPAGGDDFPVLEPSFGAPVASCSSVSISVQDEEGEGGRCIPRSSLTSAASLATV